MLTRRSFAGMLLSLYPTLRGASKKPTRHEYHVSPKGRDDHDGSPTRPLKTISAAAARAWPGDTITVHAGIYRERVAPPRGGTSDTDRIVYQAAPGERVVITGAEVVSGWKHLDGDVWTVTLPNSLFGQFNPFRDLIRGDWFDGRGRKFSTGAVYLDGDWLSEAATLDDVLRNSAGDPLWFAKVDDDSTQLWAQFRSVDPNHRLTEVNARQTVFYPATTSINYITVRGFTLRQAATPWAPPTAEQIGAIGTHWSKGWIIENNTVSHSICSGISLGKYGDQFDNTSANTAEGYVKTIERALEAGWSKQDIGSHIVRNNTISHCGQTGIVGSLGPAFSRITGNTIHDIHVRQAFSGAEIAAIKFHAAIDVEISGNHIYHSARGLWLDWMAQGTRVTGNLFHDNLGEDVFVEVDHGPFLIDNNFFLSAKAQRINSQGGAYAHNLFAGRFEVVPYDGRRTPYMKPHSTEVAGYHDNPSGDLRFFNNIFAGDCDLSLFNNSRLPMHLTGNVFLKGAKPCSLEQAPLIAPEFDPAINLEETTSSPQLSLSLDPTWRAAQRSLVDTQLLGHATIPDLPFEQPDGSLLRLDRDYTARIRPAENPFPGPLECNHEGRQMVRISGAD